MNRKEAGVCMLMYFLLASLFGGMAGLANADGTAALIKASGCASPGVQEGCVILTDSKDNKKVYTLFFLTETKPAIGTAIYFEGTARTGVDLCQQGTPVNVTNWIRIKMTCPADPKM